jgi:hypothetical protein
MSTETSSKRSRTTCGQCHKNKFIPSAVMHSCSVLVMHYRHGRDQYMKKIKWEDTYRAERDLDF